MRLVPNTTKTVSSIWLNATCLFYVLRDREVFPNRAGKKFYCCPKCTSKLYECVTFKVFRYIDNAKWKAAIEAGQS